MTVVGDEDLLAAKLGTRGVGGVVGQLADGNDVVGAALVQVLLVGAWGVALTRGVSGGLRVAVGVLGAAGAQVVVVGAGHSAGCDDGATAARSAGARVTGGSACKHNDARIVRF